MVCLTESDSVKFFAPGFNSAATLLLIMGAVFPGILSSVPNVLILRTTAVRWELCDMMEDMHGWSRTVSYDDCEVMRRCNRMTQIRLQTEEDKIDEEDFMSEEWTQK